MWRALGPMVTSAVRAAWSRVSRYRSLVAPDRAYPRNASASRWVLRRSMPIKPSDRRSSRRWAGPGTAMISVPSGLRMRSFCGVPRPEHAHTTAAESAASGRCCQISVPMAAARGCARAARRSAAADRSRHTPCRPGMRPGSGRGSSQCRPTGRPPGHARPGRIVPPATAPRRDRLVVPAAEKAVTGHDHHGRVRGTRPAPAGGEVDIALAGDVEAVPAAAGQLAPVQAHLTGADRAPQVADSRSERPAPRTGRGEAGPGDVRSPPGRVTCYHRTSRRVGSKNQPTAARWTAEPHERSRHGPGGPQPPGTTHRLRRRADA